MWFTGTDTWSGVTVAVANAAARRRSRSPAGRRSNDGSDLPRGHPQVGRRAGAERHPDGVRRGSANSPPTPVQPARGVGCHIDPAAEEVLAVGGRQGGDRAEGHPGRRSSSSTVTPARAGSPESCTPFRLSSRHTRFADLHRPGRGTAIRSPTPAGLAERQPLLSVSRVENSMVRLVQRRRWCSRTTAPRRTAGCRRSAPGRRTCSSTSGNPSRRRAPRRPPRGGGCCRCSRSGRWWPPDPAPSSP